MRLLHFDQAGRLLSTDFSGKITPPYAILSHRWGDSEVLFVDIANGSYKEKEGYRKMKFCAEQAAKDQLQYFWIDTCCIDKWNLDELSRSINSMFHWYKCAKKCYVFLPDVSVPTIAAIAQQDNWEASFRASEWFRRGWTLQELIAPESVEFFSREGQLLGNRTSLKQLVHEITGVPIEALQGCSLDRFTIQERMEWTKDRKTTEEEDIVYCLLGILDLSMPISYGEGREKARVRLETEINCRAPFFVPFSRNENFVGQEAQLAQLEMNLFGSKRAAIMAITGPGGTGKSQLALEFAYRVVQQNKSCSIFWVDASSIDGIHQSYANIARKLKIPGWNNEKIDVKQIVKLYLCRESVGQSFLIFDNVDNANLSSNETSIGHNVSLTDYLPQSKLCSALITTTNRDTARTLASQNVIELQEMEQDKAQSIFEKYLNTPVAKTEREQLELLLKQLSYLPLAIVQAAAYINNTHITLQDYRMRLVKQQEADIESNINTSDNEQDEHDRESPVTTALHLSVEQIHLEHPLAAEYLFLAACVDRRDIPLEFLEAPSSRKREQAIRIISGYKLVTRRPADSALDLHRLVHGALRGWLRKQNTLDEWTKRALTRLSEVFPDDHHGNRSMWRRMMPHAKYALSHSSRDEEDTGKIAMVRKYGKALLSDGEHKEAEQLFMQVIATRRRVLGDEHPDTLTVISNLASTYWNQGRRKEAEELNIQVMEIRRRVLGDEHSDTLTSMSNMAVIYRDLDQFNKAEELFIQVIKTEKKMFGDEHSRTLNGMGHLALMYWRQGRLKEAGELEVQIIETSRRVLGDEHPDTLNLTGNLASTYWNQGRRKEAEELLVQTMNTSKRALGDAHPDTLNIMSNLAVIYCNQDRWEEAEELELQIVETSKRSIGDAHPDTLTSMARLASTYSNQGRWKEAEELEVHVMETRKRVLGH